MPLPSEVCLRRRLLTAATRPTPWRPFLSTPLPILLRRGITGTPWPNLDASPSRPFRPRHNDGSRPRTRSPAARGHPKSQIDAKSLGHKRSLDLFQRVVEGKPGQPDAATDDAQSGAPTTDTLQIILMVQSRLRGGQMRMDEAWDAIQCDILPAMGGPDTRKQLKRLLDTIIALKRAKPDSPDLPPAAEIAAVYISAAKSRNTKPLLQMQTALLESLVSSLPPKGGDAATTSRITSSAPWRRMLEDAVRLWVLIFNGRLPPKARAVQRPYIIDLPLFESSRIQSLVRHADPFAAVFANLMEPRPAYELMQLTPALVATYVLIEDVALRSHEVAEPISRLLTLLDGVMSRVWTAPEDALAEFCNQSAVLEDYVTSRLSVLESRLRPELDPSQIHRRLSRAFQVRDVAQLRAAWNQLAKQIESRTPATTKGAEARLRGQYASVLNFCVFIWCALGQEDIDAVLALMAERGFPLTATTYTSMIEGWKQARRPKNVGLLWSRLVEEKVPLDPIIWSARISALMTCGLEKQGVRALYEMGEMWDQAVKASSPEADSSSASTTTTTTTAAAAEIPPHIVKPDIGPVNATLTGVLRTRGVKAAYPILAWASRYDIAPDVATYNMLLRAMLQEGLAAEAEALFAEMADRDIAPDPATFTTIVEEVLSRAAGRGEAARLEAVRSIFKAIRAAGQSPKAATYAKMIYVLLGTDGASQAADQHAAATAATTTGDAEPAPTASRSTSSPAIELANATPPEAAEPQPLPTSAAVQEVLAHMQTTNTPPSSHILTIVAEHYFRSGDLPSLHDMLRSFALDPTDPSSRMDGVFWETLIRGYARAGLVSEAKDLFFRLRRETRVTLSVLDQLLTGLVGMGDMQGARELVRAVVERKGAFVAGEADEGGSESERYLKHHFWHVVAEHGLVEGSEGGGSGS